MKKHLLILILLFIAFITLITLCGCSVLDELEDSPPESITVDAALPAVPPVDVPTEAAPAPAPVIYSAKVPEVEPEPVRPVPVAVLSTHTPSLGQAFGFTLVGITPGAAYELIDTHFSEPIVPFVVEDRAIALVPVTTTVALGVHNLAVVEILDGERTELFSLEYDVQAVTFTRQDLTATGAMSALMTNENIIHDRTKREAARSETSPVPLWEGLFVQPLEGRISTQFGQVRYTNGVYSSRHDAYDIAMPTGTPVVAAAAGRVVLAEELYISGKAVIIDHGLWLFTYYYHLSEIDVAEGDMVQAGDLIGKVGSTGYSTGPHLHYAASIKSENINPDYFMQSSLFD